MDLPNDGYHDNDDYDYDYDYEDDGPDEEWGDGPDGERRRNFSRRGFLGVAGVGGAVAAFASTAADPVSAFGNRFGRGGNGRGRRDNRSGRDDRGDQGGDNGRGGRDDPSGRPGPPEADVAPTRFGRIFPNLAPFAEPSEELRQALTELGQAGGILDANDPLEVGPVRLITEPELSPNNPDNPTQNAGTTFVGQFLDHDLTRDAGSTLGRPVNLRRSTNLNSPRFDLDTVYGGGPNESPELYTTEGPIRFLVESGGLFEDLPRDADNRAIIADPRNDENMMISGIQVAMLLFHNAVAEQVEAGGLEGIDAFEETRRLVRWHWQWTIVHEFLPQIIPSSVMDDLAANGPRFFNPERGQIPVEFQGAAYRFGHSMVRPSYRANLAGDNGEAFFALVFDAEQFDQPDPASLVGGHRAPRRFIGWQTFFDFGDGEVKPNKMIDTSISTPLFNLPTFAIDASRGGDLGPLTLAVRNLLRQITWELPSGQAIAAEMGVDQLSAGDLADLEPFGNGLVGSTPLWFYVLREAELMAGGETLGPVGGRIVGETFMSLLSLDETSFPGADPSFTPTLPSSSGDGDFRMVDLLTMAGVDPASRGQ